MSETLENGGYKFIRARKDDEKIGQSESVPRFWTKMQTFVTQSQILNQKQFS